MTDNEITRIIIGACIKIHRKIGAGLLESTYRRCLVYELRKEGLKVEIEKPITIYYEELCIEAGYKIDILVEDRIVVELKSVTKMIELYWSQTLTYIKLGGYRLGLLINFNELVLIKGVHRIINGKLDET